MTRGGLTFITAYVRRLSRVEVATAALVFLALFTALFAFKVIRVDEFRGDSAMYFQATENVAHGKPLASQTKASIDEYFIRGFQKLSADDIRQDPAAFFGHATPPGDRSLLFGHWYLILYPIGELARIFPVQDLLMLLYVASFVGMLLLAYSLLRRANVPALAAALFCLLIVAQPAWTYGLLWGQFYPDRLFLLLGLLVMALAANAAPEDRREKLRYRLGLVVAAIVCASINERSALVPGLFMVLYTLLYWWKPGADRRFNLGLGAALLCYGFLAVKMVLPDGEYSSFLPTSWRALVAVTEMPQFLPMVELFLLINVPLLCLAFFEWRAAVIACVMMLPNIFGNIGGAEKLGWSTHYSTFYFTPLVWAALTGYAALYHKTAKSRYISAVYGGIAAFIVFLAVLNPVSYRPLSISLANVQMSFWPAFYGQANRYLLTSGPRTRLAKDVSGLQEAIPPGSVVSSVEGGMPHLYQGRTIEFFPADIDHADYAVLDASLVNGRLTYSGTIRSTRTPKQQLPVDELVQARLKRDGYDLAHPLLFPTLSGLAVVRRARAAHGV